MKKKRAIIIGCCIFLVALFIVGFHSFLTWLNEPMHPEVPEKSSPGKIVLASRGCCFRASDTTVSLLDENGNRNILIVAENVYEYDIFECKNIPDITTPIQVSIDFTSDYLIQEDVSLLVGEFANTDELLEKGLLLYFGDGTLSVRNGNDEKKFAAGCFGDEGDEAPWCQIA